MANFDAPRLTLGTILGDNAMRDFNKSLIGAVLLMACGGDDVTNDTSMATETSGTPTGSNTATGANTQTGMGTCTMSEPLFSLEEAFTRADPASDGPSGHNVLDDCSDTGETWDGAAAMISVDQFAEKTTITVVLTGSRPDTLYTTWLRLKGTDPVTGESYGGSPLTGAGSTALAPSTEIPALDAIMNGPGEPEAYNAFWSDENGDGVLEVELDFGMIGGAYPFQNYDPALEEVPIVGAPNAPFMIRISSHCTDELAHGLVQGDRETWFNWSPL